MRALSPVEVLMVSGGLQSDSDWEPGGYGGVSFGDSSGNSTIVQLQDVTVTGTYDPGIELSVGDNVAISGIVGGLTTGGAAAYLGAGLEITAAAAGIGVVVGGGAAIAVIGIGYGGWRLYKMYMIDNP